MYSHVLVAQSASREGEFKESDDCSLLLFRWLALTPQAPSPALILVVAAGLAAAVLEAGAVWGPDGLGRQVAYRKSLPSQSSPQWKQVAVRLG